MNSGYIKAHLLNYFRFKRRFMFCATECGDYSADIIACNGKELVEIEVKVSYYDFLADFKKKKHRAYKRAKSIWIPHKFYFAVPTSLVEQCSIYLKNKKSKYGLISVADGFMPGKQLPQMYYEIHKTPLKIIISAKKLHENSLSSELSYLICQRMGSELCQKSGELHCSKTEAGQS